MHESLLLLERLHAIDAELDAHRAELWGLQKAIEHSRSAIAAAVEELAALDEQSGALKAREAALQERVDKLVRRRDRTQAQLDQGLITDVLVAQRQLENFAGIIDELELEELDLMEQREKVENKRAAVAQRHRLLLSKETRQRQALTERQQALAPRLAELREARPGQAASLPPHLLGDYEDIRASHRDAVVPLVQGACSACHMHHPPQVVLEVRRGSRLHHCRGCHRFLCGVIDPEPEAAPGAEGEDPETAG